jgi:hypothetical protein
MRPEEIISNEFDITSRFVSHDLKPTSPSPEPPHRRPGSAVSRLVTTAIYRDGHANVVVEEEEEL